MSSTFYITTPIYYVNARPHLGHAYTTIVADSLRRFHTLLGEDTWFLTGTDEHGDKIVKAAEAAGQTPQEFVDGISGQFQALWPKLGIKHDQFIRTTDADHKARVQAFLQKVYDNGDIYFGEHGGHYCTGCERFYTEKELENGLCPQHLTKPDFIQEKNYFFRMSKYLPWLAGHIRENPDFIRPERYRNEVLSMIESGALEDLCISRPKTRLEWGIELPFDKDYVCYVWFDALLNYISALGWPDGDKYAAYWPGEHLVAKDILKPHGVFWPTMLKSAGVPLYKHLNVHGYWLIKDTKMSKSLGNVVEPIKMAEHYGLDAFRYFLLRDMQFGSDASFSEEALITRFNADLANDLGNLVSRTTAMVEKYFGGKLPAAREDSDADCDLKKMVGALRGRYETEMEKFQFQNALELIFKCIQRANKYIDETAPWALAKDEANKPRLASVMYNLLESIRICTVLLTPFIPDSCEKIFAQIGACECCRDWDSAAKWGSLSATVTVHKGEAIFPRVDAQKALEELEAIQEAQKKAALPAMEFEPMSEEKVDFDTFCKSDFRAVKVKACEAVKKSEKLLRFTLDDGTGTDRQILSGIHKWYKPEELVGKTLVAIVNLPPRKMMGLESCGMLLSAVHTEKGEEVLNLIMVDDKIPAGAKLC